MSHFFKPARYFANRSSRSDKLFKISSFFGARWRKIILAILATLVILAILAISAILTIFGYFGYFDYFGYFGSSG